MAAPRRVLSWPALAAAPLFVPALLAAMLVSSSPGSKPVPFFLMAFAVGCVVSYGVTIGLFLPSLFLLSRLIALAFPSVCFLGFLLGSLAYLPIALVSWQASGTDSGPPELSFAAYVWLSLHDPMLWLAFPFGGALTAGIYWLLARKGNSTGASR
jgi:hypothetical protein